MIDRNDRLVKDAPARNRRRKSAGWKSGLMLTGLGAVVLGAGYLAGVNAPAVAQTSTSPGASQNNLPKAAVQGDRPQSLAQALPGRSDDGARNFAAPQAGSETSEQLFLGYDENGNPVYLGEDGNLVIGGNNGLGAQNQVQPQLGSRSNRGTRGFSQQTPNFGRPLTRSRGS